MTTPTPFNAGEPVSLTSGRDVVTMVEGTTFCISTATGDIETGRPQGLFFRDTRFVSGWQLRLDGQPAQALSIVDGQGYTARFVLRRPPVAGQADSTVLCVRRRYIGEGMKEVVTLSNVGREATLVRVELSVASDFADLFAVKEGRASHGEAQSTATAVDLTFVRRDGSRALLVYADREPHAQPGQLSWEAVIPARQQWEVTINAQPVIEGRRVEPRFRDQSVPASQGKSAWFAKAASVKTHHSLLGQVLQQSLHDLDALRIESPDDPRLVFLAAGAPWFMTLFGRDSLLSAWMTLPLDPRITFGTLQTLAMLQGRELNPHNEEAPGRILHESRLGPDSATALGGQHYYGTIDATPLFVALLGEAWRWGADESEVRELLPAADKALSWMDNFGDRDGDGFLEYQRATDRGLANQGWKDSWDGINDASGRLPDPPIALAEVQGYAYAAWLARAELADAFGETSIAETCRHRADKLQQLFASQFWLPEEGYFAVALDGQKRPVDAMTTNAGQCLWTGIVSDEHAAILIERLSRPDMDTGFGLRTLSDRMSAYNPMSYHNGSVWPHDTALCIAGLMRYSHLPGAVELAHRLAEGLLRAGIAFGGRLPELFCGFSSEAFTPPVPYPTSCSPQAWASAAPYMLVRAFLGLDPHVPQRKITVRPHLPAAWGSLTLDRLRLAGHSIRIGATGQAVHTIDVPAGWRVVR
ncbi:glycogen debranching N-terminal domain-containing protein [Allorhizocola rhizosphaerae]|uniref:amylo-alpha-1,6-glucosidase n=1 Tax=Allorhizocola rhizosphaerae TaxID=1872709 RepID=UPI000E3C9768|nr:glycogen debranching N-terminal domain-containing protein [Allorhizocola rhizosphaerae]